MRKAVVILSLFSAVVFSGLNVAMAEGTSIEEVMGDKKEKKKKCCKKGEEGACCKKGSKKECTKKTEGEESEEETTK